MANTGNDEGANANKYTLSLSSTPTTVVEPQEKTTHGDRAEGQSTSTSSDAVVPAAAAAAAAARRLKQRENGQHLRRKKEAASGPT